MREKIVSITIKVWWFVLISGLAVAALVLLTSCTAPISAITMTYTDGSAKTLEYVDFDMRVEGTPVLWVGDSAILCEVIGQHAHCKVGGLPVDGIDSVRVQIIDE